MSRTDILLEAGTNELEILVFRVGRTTYGVNVAKVREVILPVKPVELPQSRKEIRGVFNLRGSVLPLVSLPRYFGLEGDPAAEQRIIVTEFCDIRTGFIVDEMDKIYRISWQQLSSVPPEVANSGAALTGVAMIDQQLVLILDFERIMFEIGGASYKIGEVAAPEDFDRADYQILFAEDSATMRKQCTSLLRESGYTRIVTAADGQEAWEAIVAHQKAGDPVDLVLSDIEMPRMDGLHLCRKIRENPDLRKTPVVLFSSLISGDNLKKGEAVGADAQISKPNISELVEVTDALIRKLLVSRQVPANA